MPNNHDKPVGARSFNSQEKLETLNRFQAEK
jgi:hypothetical protein